MSDHQEHNKVRVFADYGGCGVPSLELRKAAANLVQSQPLYGNPHSLHVLGLQSHADIESARGSLLTYFDAWNEYEVVFVSGATAATHTAAQIFSSYVPPNKNNNNVTQQTNVVSKAAAISADNNNDEEEEEEEPTNTTCTPPNEENNNNKSSNATNTKTNVNNSDNNAGQGNNNKEQSLAYLSHWSSHTSTVGLRQLPHISVFSAFRATGDTIRCAGAPPPHNRPRAVTEYPLLEEVMTKIAKEATKEQEEIPAASETPTATATATTTKIATTTSSSNNNKNISQKSNKKKQQHKSNVISDEEEHVTTTTEDEEIRFHSDESLSKSDSLLSSEHNNDVNDNDVDNLYFDHNYPKLHRGPLSFQYQKIYSSFYSSQKRNLNNNNITTAATTNNSSFFNTNTPSPTGILVQLPVECNFSGARYPISKITKMIEEIQQKDVSNGLPVYYLVDAAAAGGKIPIRLDGSEIDAIVFSMYKMSGLPYGVGVLLIKKKYINNRTQQERSWGVGAGGVGACVGRDFFGGGTVEVLSMTSMFASLKNGPEAWEDGTPNIAGIQLVPAALRQVGLSSHSLEFGSQVGGASVGFDKNDIWNNIRMRAMRMEKLRRRLRDGLASLRHHNNVRVVHILESYFGDDDKSIQKHQMEVHSSSLLKSSSSSSSATTTTKASSSSSNKNDDDKNNNNKSDSTTNSTQQQKQQSTPTTTEQQNKSSSRNAATATLTSSSTVIINKKQRKTPEEVDLENSWSHQAPTVTILVRTDSGDPVGHNLVERLALAHGICLRTGCFCNHGACQAHLRISDERIRQLYAQGQVCGGTQDVLDDGTRPRGAVRISLGWENTESEVDALIEWARSCFCFAHPSSSLISSAARPNGRVVFEETKLRARVARLWLYPVKGLRGIEAASWQLDDRGSLVLDRRYAIVDRLSGRAVSPKVNSRLAMINVMLNLDDRVLIMRCTTRDLDPLLITFPSDVETNFDGCLHTSGDTSSMLTKLRLKTGKYTVHVPEKAYEPVIRIRGHQVGATWCFDEEVDTWLSAVLRQGVRLVMTMRTSPPTSSIFKTSGSSSNSNRAPLSGSRSASSSGSGSNNKSGGGSGNKGVSPTESSGLPLYPDELPPSASSSPVMTSSSKNEVNFSSYSSSGQNKNNTDNDGGSFANRDDSLLLVSTHSHGTVERQVPLAERQLVQIEKYRANILVDILRPSSSTVKTTKTPTPTSAGPTKTGSNENLSIMGERLVAKNAAGTSNVASAAAVSATTTTGSHDKDEQYDDGEEVYEEDYSEIFPEQNWKSLAAPHVQLESVGACHRCEQVGVEPATGKMEHQPLAALVQVAAGRAAARAAAAAATSSKPPEMDELAKKRGGAAAPTLGQLFRGTARSVVLSGSNSTTTVHQQQNDERYVSPVIVHNENMKVPSSSSSPRTTAATTPTTISGSSSSSGGRGNFIARNFSTASSWSSLVSAFISFLFLQQTLTGKNLTSSITSSCSFSRRKLFSQYSFLFLTLRPRRS